MAEHADHKGASPKRQDFKALEAFTLARMIETHIPAVSVAVVEKPGIMYERHFGFADLRRRTPPGRHTRYGLGSVTKVFTALAIMQLCEEGKLELATPVTDVLGVVLHPECTITVLDLLTHASGYPALGYSESKLSSRYFMDGYPISSLDDLLTFMQGATAWLQATPGKRWFYCNEGYILLGAIIERLSGLPYAEAIDRMILKPLGMVRSTFARTVVESDADRVTPYLRRREGKYVEGSNLYSEIPAAGGLVSTLSDMSRLTVALLSGGEPILSAAYLMEMQRPVLPIQQSVGDRPHIIGVSAERYQGLGFQVVRGLFGHEVIAHGGGVMGGTSYLAYVPSAGVGVVLLANAHGYPLAQLALCYLAEALGYDYRELAFVRQEAIWHQLSGHYQSYWGTIAASVTPRGGGLELQLHFYHEDRYATLLPWELTDEYARFVTFASGQLIAVDFVLAEPITLLYERYAFRKVSERMVANA